MRSGDPKGVHRRSHRGLSLVVAMVLCFPNKTAATRVGVLTPFLYFFTQRKTRSNARACLAILVARNVGDTLAGGLAEVGRTQPVSAA